NGLPVRVGHLSAAGPIAHPDFARGTGGGTSEGVDGDAFGEDDFWSGMAGAAAFDGFARHGVVVRDGGEGRCIGDADGVAGEAGPDDGRVLIDLADFDAARLVRTGGTGGEADEECGGDE